MISDKRQKAVKSLIALAAEKGYVVFDDILNEAQCHSLAIDDIDWVSETIITKGVIIYDETPDDFNANEEEYDDYAHVDYDEVYERVLELDPSLYEFINEIKRIKPPQYKEIDRLKYLAMEGNQHAKQRMFEMYLRNAVKTGLQRAVTYDLEVADNIQEACIGLLLAVEKYNPDEHGSFISYASMWSLQNMSREQSTKREQIYYSTNQKEDFLSIYPLLKEDNCRVDDELYSEERAIELIMNKLACSHQRAAEVLLMATPLESWEWLRETDEECFAIQNRLVYNTLEENIEHRELKGYLKEMLDTLSKRERDILELRYGIKDGEEKTLEEVGRIFDLTRERIRQIEAKGLKKCSHSTRRKRIEDYILGYSKKNTTKKKRKRRRSKSDE